MAAVTICSDFGAPQNKVFHCFPINVSNIIENEDHGIWSHHFMEKQWKQCQTLFWGAPKSLQMVTEAMKLKDACSLEEKL